MTTKKKPTAKRSPSRKAGGARGSKSETEESPKAPRLTDKERLFVENYLTSWNATDAARRAGYKDPELSGWENRQKPAIQGEISRRISAVAMGADECLMRLGRYARGSLRPFFDGSQWPDLETEAGQRDFDLLKKIKPKRRTGGRGEDAWMEEEIELEIHDPLRALELIGRNLKLFTDKTEVSGADGEPLSIRVIYDQKPGDADAE